jgi:hypothetical protein
MGIAIKRSIDIQSKSGELIVKLVLSVAMSLTFILIANLSPAFGAESSPCRFNDAPGPGARAIVADSPQAQKLRAAYDVALKDWQIYRFQEARKEAVGELSGQEEKALGEARSRMVQSSCDLRTARSAAIGAGLDVGRWDVELRQHDFPGLPGRAENASRGAP